MMINVRFDQVRNVAESCFFQFKIIYKISSLFFSKSAADIIFFINSQLVIVMHFTQVTVF